MDISPRPLPPEKHPQVKILKIDVSKVFDTLMRIEVTECNKRLGLVFKTVFHISQ